MKGPTQAFRTVAAVAFFAVATPSFAQDMVTIPNGTRLSVRLATTVSSESSHAGDLVVGKTTRNIRNARGAILLPAGTEVRGRVVTAYRGGKVKGRARLVTEFDRVVVRGEERKMTATRVDALAPSRAKRDAALVAGSTVGGAVIGGLFGGKKGARVGAVTGAGASTASVVTTYGPQVEFRSGSVHTVRLTHSLSVPREIKVPPLQHGQ
jgi:hypothetical protein